MGARVASVGALERRWEARLELGFELAGGRTALLRRNHRGPLGVQRPFYPERDGTCHVYLLHPPGGVAGGAELTVDVAVGEGARALITGPAAGKLYDGFGARAQQTQICRVAAGAHLEWLPQETIVFDGADAELSSRFELEPGAELVAWEIICLGRPACHERFTRGALRQRFEVYRDGEPLFVERARYAGGDPLLDARWGLRGHPVTGTLVCVTRDATALVDTLRQEVGARFPDSFAVSQLREVLVCRFLGDRVEDALSSFRAAWERLRPALHDRAPSAPRIWLT